MNGVYLRAPLLIAYVPQKAKECLLASSRGVSTQGCALPSCHGWRFCVPRGDASRRGLVDYKKIKRLNYVLKLRA